MAVLITGLYADGKCVAARLGGETVEGGADEQNTKEQEDSLKAERGKHACLAWEFGVQGSLQKYGFYEEDVMSMIFSF